MNYVVTTQIIKYESLRRLQHLMQHCNVFFFGLKVSLRFYYEMKAFSALKEDTNFFTGNLVLYQNQ